MSLIEILLLFLLALLMIFAMELIKLFNKNAIHCYVYVLKKFDT